MANRAYKGRRFEIWLAAQLSLWWTNQTRDDVFFHPHDSGGRATRRAAKGKSTQGLYGDICAVDAIGQPLLNLVAIEAKRGYNNVTIADLLDKPDGAAAQEFEKWLVQVKASQASSRARYWAIIHKRDRREPVIFLPYALYEHLPRLVDASVQFKVRWQGEMIVGVHLKEFLKIDAAVIPVILGRWTSGVT